MTSPTEFQQVRDQFLKVTASFRLQADPLTSGGIEKDLISSIRAFYVLIPKSSLTPSWPEIHKSKRRQLIRSHLAKVCVTGSITQAQIEELDGWMANLSSSRRENLKYYGRQIEAKYGPLCFICGRLIKGEKTVDHIFPFSRGGETHIDNLLLAHRECNAAKNAYIPGDSMRWAPDSLDSEVEEVPKRLTYLVYLRDEFSCTERDCKNGLFSGSEIGIVKKFSTGICCYDNLRTICKGCEKIQQN